MARPIRYCAKCGEYVDNQFVVKLDMNRELVTKSQLVHIDADGRIIHRNHAAVEEKA